MASTRDMVHPLYLATSSQGTNSPLRLLFSDENLVQRRPDPVIFRALGRKRLRKEVTEAKKKAGVQEQEEERGGGARRVSALRKGPPTLPGQAYEEGTREGRRPGRRQTAGRWQGA